jgi:hypothetical protein
MRVAAVSRRMAAARPGAEPIPMVQSIACARWQRSGIGRLNRRGIALHDGIEAIKPRAPDDMRHGQAEANGKDQALT